MCGTTASYNVATLCNTLQHAATHCNIKSEGSSQNLIKILIKIHHFLDENQISHKPASSKFLHVRKLIIIVCCSVLQRVAVCYSVLQCVAVCCSVLQCVAVCYSVLQCVAACCSVLQCVTVCCSELQCGTVCCSVLQCAE